MYMALIRRIGSYFLALFSHWWQWMSCAISTLLTFYAAKTNQPNSWVAHAIVVFAVFFLMVAAYGAWSDERNKREVLQKLVDYEKPNFELRSGQLLTSVSADLTVTTLNIPIEVINHGARSSCFAWRMKYEFPGFSCESTAKNFIPISIFGP
jgi:hypothetical protein